eukprot:gene8614-561_t
MNCKLKNRKKLTKQKRCLENLYFLEKEATFKTITDKKKLIQESKILYNTYFTDNAEYEINVSVTNLKPVRDVIFNHPEKITNKLFHKIAFEVEWMLSDNLERFNRNLNSNNHILSPTEKFLSSHKFSLSNFIHNHEPSFMHHQHSHHDLTRSKSTMDDDFEFDEEEFSKSLDVYKLKIDSETEDFWKEYETQFSARSSEHHLD